MERSPVAELAPVMISTPLGKLLHHLGVAGIPGTGIFYQVPQHRHGLNHGCDPPAWRFAWPYPVWAAPYIIGPWSMVNHIAKHIIALLQFLRFERPS